ncbi:Peptidyl-tRNA hydrolase [Maioricimonas rarisocia]|uniref:Peptidyl-tRNA hydrolase n=1 Tax=Maioricimonas rarisocia TaxID=2528026 RepID=A0A517Z3N9_9PLAN|nr:aminoacyl-tRNA hydrolase [Maioricimonas rarisocia]QDU37112.1 Peptidyl-tRNA hydrolase [Maioricimonas rarisocia]
MKVVAGLGNPGRKYTNTRHNVGFEVLAALAGQWHADSTQQKFEAEVAEVTIDGERVLLLAPQTYMNLSGRSIRQALKFFKLPPEDLLVVCDDLNLPLGRLRLRRDGSSGGQKGLQDTINQLGTNGFARLRIGIDRPPGRMDAASYVLSRYSRAERETMDEAIDRASRAIATWVREGIDAAMNQANAAPAD